MHLIYTVYAQYTQYIRGCQQGFEIRNLEKLRCTPAEEAAAQSLPRARGRWREAPDEVSDLPVRAAALDDLHSAQSCHPERKRRISPLP